MSIQVLIAMSSLTLKRQATVAVIASNRRMPMLKHLKSLENATNPHDGQVPFLGSCMAGGHPKP